MNVDKKKLTLDVNPNRIYGLDILRAFAILFVVVGHGNNLLPKRVADVIELFLFEGVSIFFVLSGFLIGGILIKILEKTHKITLNSLLDFWLRRWFRTIPNYLLILLILLFLNLLFTQNFNLFGHWKYFVFSQNLYFRHPGFFPEAWSLSVEEWFYLLIPPILFVGTGVFRIKTSRSIIFTVFGILALVTLFRYYRFLNINIENIYQWDSLFRKQVITRLDSLMYGLLGAYVQVYFKEFWINKRRLFFTIGIALFLITKVLAQLEFFPPSGLYACVFSFSVTSLSTLFLLPYLSQLKSGSGIVYLTMTRISLISYSMYLLNLSVVQFWIINKIRWDELFESGRLIIVLQYGLYWLLVIVLSSIVYKYFEVPMTNLRDNKKLKSTIFRQKP